MVGLGHEGTDLDTDPTARRMIETILAMEEEHADARRGVEPAVGSAVADAAGGILGLGNRISSADQDRLTVLK